MRDLSKVFLNRNLSMILKEHEVQFVFQTLKEVVPCNLIVFGMGFDTGMWHDCNEGGRTVFLENSLEWHDKINDMYSDIESYVVNYKTDLLDWENTLNDIEKLELDLPDSILDTKWDVAIVDGPVGKRFRKYLKLYGEPPGRMSSMYMAHKLLKENGVMFAHDFNRVIEKTSALKFFGEENFEGSDGYMAKFTKR